MTRSMVFATTLFLVGLLTSASLADVNSKYSRSHAAIAAMPTADVHNHVMNTSALPAGYLGGYGGGHGPSWSHGCCDRQPSCCDHLWDGYCQGQYQKLASCFSGTACGCRKVWHRASFFLRVPHAACCGGHGRAGRGWYGVGGCGNSCGCGECGCGGLSGLFHGLNPSHLLGGLLNHCNSCFDSGSHSACAGGCGDSSCGCGGGHAAGHGSYERTGQTYIPDETLDHGQVHENGRVYETGQDYETGRVLPEEDDQSHDSIPVPAPQDTPPAPPLLDQSAGWNQWLRRPADA